MGRFQNLRTHYAVSPDGHDAGERHPKHLGRLAGWLYRREGRPVIRCAHGGERVFFSDYEWGLAEFPDCDTYYAHSAGERDALAQRVAAKTTALVQPGQSIAFKTLGSPHHQALLERSRRNRPGNTGTIVYVAGGYLGEQLGDFPNRKPPDPLYLDWQIDLVLAIKALGYRVVVKPHPAGIAHESRFLAPYTDGELDGVFDPAQVSADAFVFDFRRHRLLSTHSPRISPWCSPIWVCVPMTRAVYDDFVTRCPVAPAGRDDRGRFRIDRERLGTVLADTIEMNTCPPGFHDRYFGP